VLSLPSLSKDSRASQVKRSDGAGLTRRRDAGGGSRTAPTSGAAYMRRAGLRLAPATGAVLHPELQVQRQKPRQISSALTAAVVLSRPVVRRDSHETFSSGLSDLRRSAAICLFGIRPSGDSSGPGIKFVRRERARELHGELNTAGGHLLRRVADGPLFPRGLGCRSVLRR
jgi:hypothetical protein